MRYDQKRLYSLDTESVQQSNKDWWTAHTMSYSWKTKVHLMEFSEAWFDDIDRRFLHAVRLFSAADNPFDELMNIKQLRGRRVLEIGCGMGCHSEMLARAGAEVNAIDLSPTSVKATKERAAQKQLNIDVRQMDGEKLEFASGSFDMVWSWGVIHHSSRTGCIVREIERVLRPGGEARIMVYNFEGMPAYISLVTRYLFGFWCGQSVDEILWRSTDGFSARFYSKDHLADLLRTFFDEIDIVTLGQDSDVVPLPQVLRRQVLKFVPISRQRALIRRRGAFLFAAAKKRIKEIDA